MTTVNAELRRLTTTTGNRIDDIRFKAGDYFRVELFAEIGLAGEEDAELFDFAAISPAAIIDLSENGPVFLRHFLLMDSFSSESAISAVEEICRNATGPNWTAVAETLGRFMHWEFEGYPKT